MGSYFTLIVLHATSTLYMAMHSVNLSVDQCDQLKFLANWLPTPLLSHNFALSEK